MQVFMQGDNMKVLEFVNLFDETKLLPIAKKYFDKTDWKESFTVIISDEDVAEVELLVEAIYYYHGYCTQSEKVEGGYKVTSIGYYEATID